MKGLARVNKKYEARKRFHHTILDELLGPVGPRGSKPTTQNQKLKTRNQQLAQTKIQLKTRANQKLKPNTCANQTLKPNIRTNKRLKPTNRANHKLETNNLPLDMLFHNIILYSIIFYVNMI